jgi:hypothetical protein
VTPQRYLPLLLLAISVWLHHPLWSPAARPYRDSIEPGYASMARFIAQHPNPWGWNPTQYGGMPTQFMYLPVVPYSSAAVSWITGVDPAHAVRLVTGTLALLAPLTLYALVFYFLQTPWWAFVTGLAYLVFSPSYGVIEAIDKDRGLIYLPWRLQVLMKYGESPHNAALALLPLAWIALWRAATKRDHLSLFLAALALAAVTLTNWIGALALAISCSTLLLAVLGKAREHNFSFARAFAAAALAYLLSAFWLTPSFIGTIAFNWPKDAYEYKVDDRSAPLFAAWLGGILVLRLLFLGRRQLYLCWSTMTLWAFGFLSVVFYSWKHDILPESRRYTLEFELFVFIAIGAWLWHGLRSPNSVHRFCAWMPLALMFLQGATQLKATFAQRPADWKLTSQQDSIEYKISQWLAQQQPQGRIFATGGLRFRLNSYTDLAQAGGTFESGLTNRTPLSYIYQVRTGEGSTPGEEAADALRQLQTLGVEYVVVHGVASAEYYRDFKNPAKFEGHLERVATFGPDVIYKVPFRSLATNVGPDQIPQYSDWRLLTKYGEALADTNRPAPVVEWQGPTRLKVSGVQAKAILAVNAHPGWGAPSNALGWMTLDSDKTLEFRPSTEQMAFGCLSLAAWTMSLVWIRRRRKLR